MANIEAVDARGAAGDEGLRPWQLSVVYAKQWSAAEMLPNSS